MYIFKFLFIVITFVHKITLFLFYHYNLIAHIFYYLHLTALKADDKWISSVK